MEFNRCPSKKTSFGFSFKIPDLPESYSLRNLHVNRLLHIPR